MRDFALEVHFSQWEFAAKYHMTASDAESLAVPELLALASSEDRAGFEQLWLGYTETQGAPDLREAIAGTYEGLSAEHIQCFAGAEEGVYIAMRCLLNQEDHAIVVVPNYQAAETLPLSICDVTGVALDPNDDWQLDMDALKRAIQPNTKLISINFPNNPTGAILHQDRFETLVSLCREHGLWLFSDEVYRLLEVDEEQRALAADQGLLIGRAGDHDSHFTRLHLGLFEDRHQAHRATALAANATGDLRRDRRVADA